MRATLHMWRTTRSSSDPVVEYGGDGFWIVPMTGDRYLVTRVSDSRRVGIVKADGRHRFEVVDAPPDDEPLARAVAKRAQEVKLLR